MAFVDLHDLKAARAPVLERQGRYGEMIKQCFEDDQAPVAFDVFLRHIGSTSRDAAILNTITNFLWRYLSFGRRTWKKCAGVPMSKVVALLGEVLNQNLGERDYNMVSGTLHRCSGRANPGLDRTDQRLQTCFTETQVKPRFGSCQHPS